MGKRRKRQMIDVRLNPKILEMIDVAGEELGVTRTKVIELGACLVCNMAEEIKAGVGDYGTK